MSRLQTVLRNHPLTIETPPIFQKSTFLTPFTLHFQGRSLQDTMQSEQTITPIQAMTSLFVLIDAARTDPAFRKVSEQKEKALRKLLRSLYTTFWHAFEQDQQEQLEQQRVATRAAFASAPSTDLRSC